MTGPLASLHLQPMPRVWTCTVCDTEWTSTDPACFHCGQPGGTQPLDARIHWLNQIRPETPG